MMPHRDWIQDGRSPAREVHQEHMSAADIAAAQQWVNEINTEHHDELELIARIKGTEDGVDWRTEELDDVHLAYVDEDGLHLEEVLCSSLDDRCVAIDLPVPWPSGMPLSRLPEMRQAYNDIVQKAYASLGSTDVMPPEYERQQQELMSLMKLMNSEYQRLLKFYTLYHARDALSPTEEVESATMVQLTYQGLSLEITSVELPGQPRGQPFPKNPNNQLQGASPRDGRLVRNVWSTSILFARTCSSPEEVEQELIEMFEERSEESPPQRHEQYGYPMQVASAGGYYEERPAQQRPYWEQQQPQQPPGVELVEPEFPNNW